MMLQAPGPTNWSLAYRTCQWAEDNVYPAGAVPFIYDVRVSENKFGPVTSTMAGFLNRSDTRAALHVAAPWVQMDGGQVGNRELRPASHGHGVLLSASPHGRRWATMSPTC
jgi:hypothetical protein